MDIFVKVEWFSSLEKLSGDLVMSVIIIIYRIDIFFFIKKEKNVSWWQFLYSDSLVTM